MSSPTFSLGVAFNPANGPLDTNPTWTELSGDMETLAVARGRQTEDDTAATGTCTAVLSDDDRRYDPNNSASPYYPNVLPMRPMFVQATLDSVIYPVFYGWVDVQDGWVRQESEPGRALVTLPANDGFDILANSRLVTYLDTVYHGVVNSSVTSGTDFAQELTGARIAHALGYDVRGVDSTTHYGMDPSWPSVWQALDAGQETMQAVAAANNATTTPLQAIRDAETTEPGFFFFDRNGYATFHDRHHRPLSTSSATFCDEANTATGRVQYASATTRRTAIVNDARATRNGGTEQHVENDTSIASFLRRAKSWSTQHLTDAAALAFAQWMLSLKADSYEILESLTLTPGTDSETWIQVLTRELGDRITVVRTPPGGGSPVTEDYFIEAVSFSYGPAASASCTWRLSSAAAQTNYWLAGVVGSSEAGTTTKAGY